MNYSGLLRGKDDMKIGENQPILKVEIRSIAPDARKRLSTEISISNFNDLNKGNCLYYLK